jgi:S-DNA-T family DNA segregation ATPase FtsK/SpoIIIE
MAYQTRGRDPLLDSNMQAAIEKRGKELIGIALLVCGMIAAAMIGSYTPDDPNWMVSTDAPVQNWLGRFGASLAAPLFMIVGWGAWALALVLLAWGVRFMAHQGEDRAIGRLIFAPIAIALCSIYASTETPGAEWLQTHSFGLGGLFGDTVTGALLTILPLGSAFAIKLVSLLMGVAMVAMLTFVLGFTKVELARILRFLVLGVVVAYAGLIALLSRGFTGGLAFAGSTKARMADRKAQAAEAKAQQASAEPRVRRAADPVLDDVNPTMPEAERQSILAKIPAMIRRPEKMPEPELVQPNATANVAGMPGDDRIKSKIADVIKSRVQTGSPDMDPAEAEAASRKPTPMVLNTGRSEPPLTAPRNAPPAAIPAAPSFNEAHMYRAEPILDAPEDADDMADDMYVEPLIPQKPVPNPQARGIVQNPVRKAPAPSRKAIADAQPALKFEDKGADFELPPLNLLTSPEVVERLQLSDEALEENARMLESVLDDYGVKGEIVSVRPGPVVTMYELEPAPGLKASRVIGLADDIARSMAALSARVSTVPGRSVIGIELPNEVREKVVLREILSARDFGDSNMRLPLALGKDIGGDPVIANLAKMPHLLIAGTTGSGKSVAINTMILSLLYKLTPEECRLIMIDPKMLELSVYDGIPHLLSPVVTDPKKAVVALKWTVGEMEERYRKMSKMGVRNIEGYNGRVREAQNKNEMFSRTVQTGFDDETGEPVFETEEFAPETLPYIVVIVDEMADLMMVAGKEIEACIQRLAQMARASGIHLIMATQRPSVDVITGTIKANFPTRISFQVTSKIDSRTILGEMGAEQLLGMGDMLYMAGGSKIVRCHGPFVADEEVEEIVNYLKGFGAPEYINSVLEGPEDDGSASDIDLVLGLGGNTDGEDALYDTAVAIVVKDRKCSTSYIQRKLAIGYNKAARLVEQMEENGLVSPANHVGKRDILVPEQQ